MTKKPKITTIVFDVGGVQYFYDHMRAAKPMAKYLGISARKIYKVLTMHAHKPGFTRMSELKSTETQYWKEFVRILKIEKYNYKELTNLWNKIFYSNKQMLRLIPKLAKKYKLGILSNMDMGHKKYLLFKKIDKQFPKKNIIWSCDVDCRKPDPKIYRIVLKRLKVRPSEVIFVDDFKRNIKIAKKVGEHGILYKNHKKFLKDLKRLGVEI